MMRQGILILVLFLALPTLAQTVRLSAEQQQMLDQLPAALSELGASAVRDVVGTLETN